MKWDNLTMSQKQALMKIYVNNGVTNLDEIVNHYNRFRDGGFTSPYNHGDKYSESDECAYFSNHTLNDQGYMMSGNAWTPRGGDIIYNGFDSQKRPSRYNEKDYDTYVSGAVKDFYSNFNTKDTLDANKVYTVNMYYKSSPNKEKAFKEGKNVYGTHTGYLNFDPKDNQWYVTHNIHGTIHKQRFFDLQRPGGNIGITAVFEPRKNTIGNRIRTKLGFAEGGPVETLESPNIVMYSRTPRESVGNVVNTRPVSGLITMTEVPRIGAGINLPFKELIDRFVLESKPQNNNINVINTDSINRPVSYITRPSRINRFDDGGIKDTWKPKYWFTPKYEAESLKEAITKAYDDGKKGDNIIYKGNAYKALLNDTDELQYNKEKQWENNRSITKDQVVDTYIDKIMWTMENPNNTGYNPKNKKYYVYSDIALAKNIGPGIAYTSETGKYIDYDKGYTKKELNELIRPELMSHMNEIENQLHSKYGEAADTMSLGNRIALLDIAHNVRPKENKKANMPVTGFPKLTESMMMGNDKSARKNTYSGSKRRQLMRNDLLWLNDFSDFILKNR